MTIDDINNKIQAERDSYNRNLNRLQKEIYKLKTRHQRNMEYLQHQKEQIKQKNQHKTLNTLIEQCYK